MSSRKYINYIGSRYGRLLVISFAGKRPCGSKIYKCKCDCGNIKDIGADSLRKGQVSCGCFAKEQTRKRRIKDLKGQRFGLYTVICISEETKKSDHARWKCVCDCGTQKIVGSDSLLSGGTTSCECYQSSMIRQLSKGNTYYLKRKRRIKLAASQFPAESDCNK